jgi:hypothetical protein
VGDRSVEERNQFWAAFVDLSNSDKCKGVVDQHAPIRFGDRDFVSSIICACWCISAMFGLLTSASAASSLSS